MFVNFEVHNLKNEMMMKKLAVTVITIALSLRVLLCIKIVVEQVVYLKSLITVAFRKPLYLLRLNGRVGAITI